MSATGQRLLGLAVWRGARWYVRRRYMRTRAFAFGGLAGLTALGAAAALAAAGRRLTP